MTIKPETPTLCLQKEFTPLVEDAAIYSRKYFAQKLLAIYLHGSIATGDAIPCVSDLDCHMVISEALSPEDRRYLEQLEKELQQRHAIVNGIHLSVHSTEELTQDKFARFVLQYNAMLYYGKDIVTEINNSTCETYEPNAQIAKERLAFARQCFKQALDHKQPACTGTLPADTYYIARKYARYFVIIEGAYFLMSQNKFESFEKGIVLNQLYKHTSGFEKELDMTGKILKDPKSAGIPHNVFLKRIRLFVEWMFDQIGRRNEQVH